MAAEDHADNSKVLSVTFLNTTKEPITLFHDFKNFSNKFTLKADQPREERVFVAQTYEKYRLVDSTGAEIETIGTDELPGYKQVTVSKDLEGNRFIITKVPRTNQVLEVIQNLIKGKDDTLPTVAGTSRGT